MQPAEQAKSQKQDQRQGVEGLLFAALLILPLERTISKIYMDVNLLTEKLIVFIFFILHYANYSTSTPILYLPV